MRPLSSGARTPKQLAAGLGCSEQALHNWQRQDEADRGERAWSGHVGGASAAAGARARKQGVASGARGLEAGSGFLGQGDRSAVSGFRFVEKESAQFPVSLLTWTVPCSNSARRPRSSRPTTSRAPRAGSVRPSPRRSAPAPRGPAPCPSRVAPPSPVALARVYVRDP